MGTISLNQERAGLIAVAAASCGFMAGVLLTRYLSSKGEAAPIDRTMDDHRDDDTMSFMDTPRSMDSNASFAFQPKSSRLSHLGDGSAENGIGNANSSSAAIDIKMALLMRVDLSMSVGELAKHCCTASIGQYKKLFKIKAPELKQWEKGAMKKDCYGVDSEEELIKVREAARQQGFATRGVVDGEGDLVLLAVGPGPGAKLSHLLSGMAQSLQCWAEEDRVVLLAVGPDSGAKVSQILRGIAQRLE